MLTTDPAEKRAHSPSGAARAVPLVPRRPPPSMRPLRLLALAYIALWIFEGAFRKWITPGLATPLLVIRDPVLLALYALAFARGAFPRHFMVKGIVFVAVIAFALSFVSTDLPIIIQLYGLRANFLHLPLIFLMPKLFDRDDVRMVGKWMLIIAPGMGLLVGLQFLSPAGGFLNRGAGGGDSGMLESAFGHIRPSGTFSFTNGLSGFTSLVAAFYLHHLLEKRVFSKWLWLAAGPSLLVMITLSGSRAGVGLIALIMASVVFICFFKGRYWQPALKLIVVGVLAFIALGSFAIFKDGLSVFTSRFGSSDNVRVGFVGRFTDSLVEPYKILKNVPTNGVGLGLGTNVGGMLITGKRTFLVAEGEWPRVLMESGAIVGSMYIILRGMIVVCLGLAGFQALYRQANTLPLLIFGGCFVEILQGQFGQPTGLGFAVIAGGLSLAACKVPVPKVAEPEPVRESRVFGRPVQGRTPRPAMPAAIPVPEPGVMPAALPDAAPAVPGGRGRSIYAERLHGRVDE